MTFVEYILSYLDAREKEQRVALARQRAIYLQMSLALSEVHDA